MISVGADQPNDEGGKRGIKTGRQRENSRNVLVLSFDAHCEAHINQALQD